MKSGIETVQWFFTKDTINAGDTTGNTALHQAALLGLKDVVRHLVQNGAKANVHNLNNETPFSIALNKGYKDIADILKTVPTQD